MNTVTLFCRLKSVKSDSLFWRGIFHSFVLFHDFLLQFLLLSAEVVHFLSQDPLLLMEVLFVVHCLGQQVVILSQQQRHL